MLSGRKAQTPQSASNAAVLVVIIALLIILYVLMLPPDVRDSLLGDTSTSPSVPSDSREGVLLSWVPDVQEAQAPTVRQLPFFELRTQVRGDVLAERSGVSVERSVFHQEADTLTFSTPQNAREVLLSFNVQSSLGRLQILLNGESIYDSTIQRRQPEPISIPVDRLQESNELEFRVSGVGFSFWQTNEYVLSNVRVTADVTDFARAQHTQQFVIDEVSRVRRASIGFIPSCDSQQGRLSLTMNGAEVYSGFPACNIPISVDIPPSRLNPVQNTLEWRVSSGAYTVDQVEVGVIRESTQTRGQFSLAQDELQRIVSGSQDVFMSLRFASPGAQGAVLLNGEPLRFRTSRQEFSGAITPYLRSGVNTVEVRESSTPVALLEVRVR